MGKIVGLDLHLRRPSIVCVLNKFIARFLKSKDEVKDILEWNPEIVVLDAPLSIEIPFRDFERELMKRDYRFFPLSMKTMKELAKKAIEIKKELENIGIKVFETHPGSLSRWIRVNIKDKDERDAFLCAFIGFLYERGVANRVEHFLFL